MKYLKMAMKTKQKLNEVDKAAHLNTSITKILKFKLGVSASSLDV